MDIYSFSPFGYEGSLVTVEVDLRRGIPAIDMVGLADGAVKESRERMRSAIRNSGFDFPPERVLISLSPADLKKEGAGFDLPIALSVLCAKEEGEEKNILLPFPILVMGELELSGNIRPVRGVHAAASTAKAAGIMHCIVPEANGEEAREVSGMKVFQATTLQEAFSALSNQELFTATTKKESSVPKGTEFVEGVAFPPIQESYGFEDVHGQQKLVRAIQIAVAGRHNILAFGPPGCGKTLALMRFQSLMPLLTVEEAHSVTRIHSLAGLLKQGESLMRTPPFRTPHQTASIEGMCGGGPNCRPGEISLSHNGALFLDEAAEFKTSVLQMLRVPLETRSITLSRAGRTTVYPASFQLLMATNPCPCGNFGSEKKICLCSAKSIEQYWKKFSAPLLDRIDIRIKVDSAEDDSKTNIVNSMEKSYSTKELRIPIARAVITQRWRQGVSNALLSPEQVSEYCALLPEVRSKFEGAIKRYSLSARGVSSCLKLARTIADMSGAKEIQSAHILEAVELRSTEGVLS